MLSVSKQEHLRGCTLSIVSHFTLLQEAAKKADTAPSSPPCEKSQQHQWVMYRSQWNQLQVIQIHSLQFDMTYCTHWERLLLLIGKKRSRCGEWWSLVEEDCGHCHFCADKPKFGGPRRKKRCPKRKCESTIIFHSLRSSCLDWQHSCNFVKVHCCQCLQQSLERLTNEYHKSFPANLLVLSVSVVYNTIVFTDLHCSEHGKCVAKWSNWKIMTFTFFVSYLGASKWLF